mgnify:CR=1 FL=1
MLLGFAVTAVMVPPMRLLCALFSGFRCLRLLLGLFLFRFSLLLLALLGLGAVALASAAATGTGGLALLLLLGGYFLGLVLEELSYLFEILLKSRQKAEKKVCAENKYQKYDFEKGKAALLSNEKEVVSDEPLTHIIMSVSFQIAFTFFLLIELLDAVCCNDLISDALRMALSCLR